MTSRVPQTFCRETSVYSAKADATVSCYCGIFMTQEPSSLLLRGFIHPLNASRGVPDDVTVQLASYSLSSQLYLSTDADPQNAVSFIQHLTDCNACICLKC